MHFEFYPLRFTFAARDSVFFPAGKPGNILRGAFGTIFRRIACVPGCTDTRTCPHRGACAYARMFEPYFPEGPSGLADSPRPFVFRARHLDGWICPPESRFHFDVHVFDMQEPAIAYFILAFAEVAREGLGPRRGRAVLDTVELLDQNRTRVFEHGTTTLDRAPEPVKLSLNPLPEPAPHLRVLFLSPTELKSGHQLTYRPDFGVLFGRIRDRIATLRARYGSGRLDADFKAMGERANRVRLSAFQVTRVQAERRSSRTGAVHPMGGFIGWADYEGDLREFVPWLQAAYWTGVGRQTVWGKGEIALA